MTGIATPTDLPDYKNSHVVIVGDLMLDRYWHGSTSRISPEAPVPVVHVGEVEERPGGAGNVALNITAVGGHATVLGLIGDDEAGVQLTRILQQAGVDCQLQTLSDKPTITKLRVMSRHQQLIRLDFEDGFEESHVADLPTALDGLAKQAGAIILSDYGKGTLSQIQSLISTANNTNTPVLIDPKGTNFARYRGATLLTPNMSEFEAVVGKCHNDAEIEAKGMQLMQSLDLNALLITRSERGMTLLQKDQAPIHLPTQAQEVFDVTGAGDTVISVLAASLAAGETLPHATALANLAAGIVVSKLGTATASPQELMHALHEEQRIEGGIVTEAQLVQQVRAAQQRGEKVIMTNGCFDILHSGHVTYLQQAAKLGERLIVAVNDDASVRQLKGASRPVNTLDCRMHVLSALESVDWVVPFSGETPEELICNVLPDILVKGGDYQPEQIAGGKCVIDNGGEVRVLGFVEGHSTTDIIKSLQKK